MEKRNGINDEALMKSGRFADKVSRHAKAGRVWGEQDFAGRRWKTVCFEKKLRKATPVREFVPENKFKWTQVEI